MTIDHDEQSRLDIDVILNGLASHDAMQSNCMYQLALMLARIATEPGLESFKEDASQALMAVIRTKPKTNVVPLFGKRPTAATEVSGLRATG